MGLYKLCKHKGRARDTCNHAWWGSFQFRGDLKRTNLETWARESVRTKTKASSVFDRMKEAIRAGRFSGHEDRTDGGPVTFNQLVPVYIERYVKGHDLASADTIEYRMVPLLDRFGSQRLSEIKQGDIEEFIADLRQPSIVSKGQKTVRVRKPATINRYISLLRHMFSWAIDHELLDQSPMRRIRQLREDNRRYRRISPDEEQGLLEAAAPHLCLMIIFALDTGMRRGEMLWLRWDDLEARPGWIRVRGETAKSGRTRWVPIGTVRLQAVLDFLRMDASGHPKPGDAPVFSNAVGEPTRFFRTAWEMAVLRANGIEPKWGKENQHRTLAPACREAFRRIDLRWHDLRHEYASRLVERGVPLSQVRPAPYWVTPQSRRRSVTTTRRRRPSSRLRSVWRRINLSRIFQDRPSKLLPPTRPSPRMMTLRSWKN